MQILKLDFAGVGPFPVRHVIDFTRFADSGLFLIDGPTGAGKTTIIDAIVFALYGQPAGGDDSSKDRIVSTFLHSQATGVEPYVDLTVDTRAGLRRVRRTPEYQRRKKRGDGVTTEHSSIQLWRLADLDDPGVLITSLHGEAEDQLQKDVGLNRAQFTQTVVLPQGQFAAFLRAKPEARAEMLQDIFGTRYYERLRDQLKTMASAHRAGVEQARNDAGQAADVFLSLAWSHDDASADDPAPTTGDAAADAEGPGAIRAAVDAADADQVLELAQQRIQALAGRHATASLAAAEADSVHEAAQRCLQQGRELAERIGRRQKLAGRLQALEAEEPAVLADQARLRAADQAEQAADPLRYATDATQERLLAEADWQASVNRVMAGPDADLPPTNGLQGLPPEGFQRRMTDEVQRLDLLRGSLAELVALEGSLPSRREALASDQQAHLREQDAINQARDQLRGLRDALLSLEAERAEAAQTAEARADAQLSLDAARQVAQAALKVQEFTEELIVARGSELRLDAECQATRLRARQARVDWLDDVAGVLAEGLSPDQPCPVCGGVEHPLPARQRHGALTPEELQGLEAAADLAGRQLAQAIQHTRHLTELVAEQQTRSNGLDRARAAEQVRQAQHQLQVAVDANDRAQQLQSKLQQLRETSELAQEELVSRDRQAAAMAAELQSRSQALDADTARVTDGCRGCQTVTERSAALRVRAELAGALAKAAATLARACQAEQQRGDELAEALARLGFGTAAQVRSAALGSDERSRLRERLQTYRLELAGVRNQLAEPGMAGLDEVTPPDLDAAELAASEAGAFQNNATQQLARAEHLLQTARGAYDTLAAAFGNLTRTLEKSRPYVRLCELACGREGNDRRITLPTFVLMRRFEEVVDTANTRLHAMTLGRYSLLRSEEREGRAQQCGLGLRVIDHSCNDVQRDPKTLSGGETFLTSLALALGLADAVTAEAGGIQLDTLFIDEGFGTLDPATLDLVMGQLAELQHEGGRTVGVISHVSDLQQRIADQIVVTKGPDGTSQIHSTVEGAVSLGRELVPGLIG